MASTALLSSKVVILEEEPAVPGISALPSAVCLCVGITERGPIADATLFTSFDEYFKVHGGFTLNSEVAVAVHGFFYQGGSFMWVSRTCHFTDLTDPTTYIAATGSVTLQNSGSAASAGIVTGTDVAPFNLEPGDHIDIKINGAAATVATILATAAVMTTAAVYPIALAGGETMGIVIVGDFPNSGVEQTVTVPAPIPAATALDIANLLNSQLTGCHSEVSGSDVNLSSDHRGNGATVAVATAGTLGPLLIFGAPTAGTGNVANTDSILGAEIEAIVETAEPTCNVIVNGNGTLSFATVALGATETIQIDVTSTVDFGCDNLVHSGADAAAQDTVIVSGKTPGAYTDDITIGIQAATNGQAASFNFLVMVDGQVKEVFPNLTMDVLSADYIETRINDLNQGSDLISVADQLLGLGDLLGRPVSATSSALTGGDDGLTGVADSDYIGNSAGPTGLYCFDRVNTGRILIVPGASTEGIHKAMLDYAETWRNGSMFCVLDCPAGYTKTQIVNYVATTATLLEYSEFGAIYWPRIKVINPSPAIYGTSETITVPPSGWIAGLYAKNDQQSGGIYESPAGLGISHGYGVIKGMVGVEDSPDGSAEHEVVDERTRDYIYPYRINPITRLPGKPWHIDGGRTLKSTGNFPNVGERRGVIFIETTLQQSLLIFKHRANNRKNRMKAKRIITQFLIQEMNKDAFRSTDPETAFFVDASDQLNPLANVLAGIMTIRIGLATNKPAEFIVLVVTQDTRALDEQQAA